MRIILPSATDKEGKSLLSNRFGRASYMTIYENGLWHTTPNSALKSMGGAGVQSAQFIINQKADVLIAQNIGPKAWQILSMGNLDIYEGITDTLENNLKAFRDNKLKKITAATNPSGVNK
jgi:predicted Fe-Mo cluster-binding NifX family protein